MIKNKGFTLIEVLIGVAILSSMSVMIFSTLNRSLTGKERVDKRTEIYHAARVGMNKITHDISQAFIAHSQIEGSTAAFKTGLKGSADSIDFSTMSHFHYAFNDRDTDHIVVGYSLTTNDLGLSNLNRRETKYLKEKLDEGGESFVLIENLKEFHLEYYDSKREEWKEDWDTGGLSEAGTLPQAIKITFVMAEVVDEEDRELGREYTFSTVIPIALYKEVVNI